MKDSVDIIMTGETNLKKCFDIASGIWEGFFGYKVIDDKVHQPKMLLYWYNGSSRINPMKDVNWFPYKMDKDEISNFVWGWLKRVDYGEEPDTDGSTGKGFRFRCQSWVASPGEDFDGSYVGAVISPEWMVYRK